MSTILQRSTQKEAEQLMLQMKHRLPGFAPSEALKLLGMSVEEWQFVQGRYERQRSELAKLRVGVARIAEALGMEPTQVPGPGESWSFQLLHEAATNYEHGWNALCAEIINKIEEQRREADTHSYDDERERANTTD